MKLYEFKLFLTSNSMKIYRDIKNNLSKDFFFTDKETSSLVHQNIFFFLKTFLQHKTQLNLMKIYSIFINNMSHFY
jgi:hypothetical protein